MKLKLISDFQDYWHKAFDKEGYPFRMVTTEGPSRVEMFKIFKSSGIKTPLFGNFYDLERWGYPEFRRVVIYDDSYKHCGEANFYKLPI